MSSSSLRYKAFLSYSHEDSKQTERLHRKLESYRVPGVLRKEASLPARLQPVFRDRDELASASALSSSIENALDDSEALIVVCSPAASASRWVNEEIRYFRTKHPNRPVLAFIIAGDPGQDPRQHPGSAAFPLDLLLCDPGKIDGELGEPLAADAREKADGFSAAFLKLAAGLLGVGYDKLRQREHRRQQQRYAVIGGASVLLSAVFAFLAWQATLARDDARAAQSVAELELTSERQTRNFLLSVFQLADPGEAQGSNVTVREVLDRAVARIDNTSFSRPVIKSRFLATMGQAYGSLGLNHRGTELLQQSLDNLPPGELGPELVSQKAASQTGLADVLFDMGNYEQALAVLDSAVEGSEAAGGYSSAQLARLANIRGDILSYNEEDAAALDEYERALALVDSETLPVEEDVSIRSRSIGGIGLLQHFAGDTAAAERLYSSAVDLLVPVYGEDHPDSIWALSSRAAAAFENGNTAIARESWERLLGIASRVYDEDNPEIATLKNSLGLLLLISGEFERSESLLREAIRIDRKHRESDFDDLTYPLNNLALARISSGDSREGKSLLLEALEIAMAADHIWLSMVLNNLADLECMDRNTENGLKLTARAQSVGQEQFGDDDWRSKRAVITAAYCQATAGANPALADLDPALMLITARWGEENLYSQRAIMQLRDIFKLSGDLVQSRQYAERLRPWMNAWEPQQTNNASSPF